MALASEILFLLRFIRCVPIRGQDVEESTGIFCFLYPGTYKLSVEVERHYRSGRVFSGSRMVTRGEVTLEE